MAAQKHTQFTDLNCPNINNMGAVIPFVFPIVNFLSCFAIKAEGETYSGN